MTEFILILPEIFLALTLAFVVISEISYHEEESRWITPTAIIGMSAAFIQTVLTYQYGAAQILNHAVSIDGLSLFFKLFFILLGALAIILSAQTAEIPRQRRTEYAALVIAATLGMCLAASSANMLLAFLCLQFVNILAFFMAGYGKRSVLSIEAAVKYMSFSAVAGALLLYGLAILFASTHSLNIYEMHRALLAQPPSHDLLLVAFVLIFLSFSFQLGAFPMYIWTPDVLEGSPTPASAFLSLAPRAAGVAVALRFLIVVFAQPALSPGQWQILGELDWTRIVALISGITMLFGTLLAFRQKGAKRLVGCLVIAQTGFLLIGLLVLDQVGIAAILYSLVIELFSLLGAYSVLSYFFDELGSDRLKDLQGVLRRAVPECICLVLFLLCLVGIPPLPGFIGKFALIGAAVRHQWLFLAVIAIFSTALSTISIVRLAFSLVGDFQGQDGLANPAWIPAEPGVSSSTRRRGFLICLIIPIVLAGVFAEAVLGWAGQSLGFILW